MTKVERCNKYFWMQAGSVVTRCRSCEFTFHVGVGLQFSNRQIIPVECIRCRKRDAVPVLKDRKTLAAV